MPARDGDDWNRDAEPVREVLERHGVIPDEEAQSEREDHR